MAQRRVIRNSLFDEDKFYDLPDKSKLVYFAANALADDDGFFTSANAVLRKVKGSAKKDFECLINAGFVIAFEDGGLCLADWKANNSIQADRYHPTKWQTDYKCLGVAESGWYYLNTKCIQNVSNLVTQCSEVKCSEDEFSKNLKSEVECKADNPSQGDVRPNLGEASKSGLSLPLKIHGDYFNNNLIGFIDFCKKNGVSEKMARDIFDTIRSMDWKTTTGKVIDDLGQYVRVWKEREKKQSLGAL